MSFGGINFGSGSTVATTTTATTGGINFGFGSNTAPSGTLGSLGQPSTAAPAAAAAAPAGFTGLNFGAAASTANPLLAGISTTTVAKPLLGGTTSSTTGGFSFGAKPATTITPAASGLPAFGAAPVAAAVGGLGGSALATTTATTTAATIGGFSFGSGGLATTATTAAPSVVAPFSFGGGLGGSAAPVSTTGLGGAAPTFGLGGVQPPVAAAATCIAGEAAGVKMDGKATKETPLPQDIFATISAFESFKSVEKAASEANLRQSAAAFHKLGDDCQKLRCHVTRLATLHASLQQRVNGLKEKIIRDSDDLEMARRTQSTPAHLQGDNTAPELYFVKAVQGFEQHMLVCRERIEEVEKCLAVAGQQQNNDAALRELVRRQHDALQVAASHVYKLHAKLIQLNTVLPCAEQYRPKPMFREGAGDLSKLDDDNTKSSVPKESEVIRSCFDLSGGASRLGTFQLNMAKARALSLNPAPPPTQGLQSQPALFGSNFGMQANTFGTGAGGSHFNTGSTFGSGSFNSGANTLGFGNKTNFNSTANTGFGSNFSFNSPSSSSNTQAGSLFSSTFGQSNKLFKT